MEEITKHINDTNASFRHVGAGDAKNTDLFLDNEHYELFRNNGEQITVRFDKTNLTQAILFIASILPRKFDHSAIHEVIYYSDNFVFDQLAILDAIFKVDGLSTNTFTQIWNARKDVPQKNGKIDTRFYFNGLLQDVQYTNSKGETKRTKFTIRNYFAGGYSNLHIQKAADGIFDIRIDNVTEPYNDGKEDGYEEVSSTPSVGITKTLQQIYYGAPGTGKSHAVKTETEAWEKRGRVVRTTFHPDSDYATFVGAYKPTTESVQRYDIYNKPMTRDGVPVMEQVITYEFVEQAFLQAYIDAWKNREEPEFLIIEEINRGNCAQIFGDLFQLLDRGDDGYSEYAIRADRDLQKHLSKAFDNTEIEDYPNVKAGKELVLPSNLYIRATMNTSDQSLFPIDSAFKRRWDWKYVPIAKGNDNGTELNWMIDVDGDLYDWWTFVRTINKHVFSTTNSEDKQLGFFFCKAKDNIISAETFVCKVIFYLWNDVFKDFGFDDKIFDDNEDNENTKLSFDKFYMANGNVNEGKIKMFLENLGMMPIEEYSEEVDDESENSNGKTIPKYSINGSSEQFSTPNAVRYIIENYAKQNENISVDEMIQLWNGIAERNNLLVPTWQPSPNDNQPFANKRRVKIEWGNSIAWLIMGWTEALFRKFIQNVKQKLDISIERVN